MFFFFHFWWSGVAPQHICSFRYIIYSTGSWLWFYFWTLLLFMLAWSNRLPRQNLLQWLVIKLMVMTISLLRAHNHLIQNMNILEFHNGQFLDFLGSEICANIPVLIIFSNFQWLLWSPCYDWGNLVYMSKWKDCFIRELLQHFVFLLPFWLVLLIPKTNDSQCLTKLSFLSYRIQLFRTGTKKGWGRCKGSSLYIIQFYSVIQICQ